MLLPPKNLFGAEPEPIGDPTAQRRWTARGKVGKGDPETSLGTRKRKKQSTCKAVECLLCRSRYTRDDVLYGSYRLETMICSRCYFKQQNAPYSTSCFGKATFILLDGSKLLGYNPKALECKKLCLDREVCKLLVKPGRIEANE